MTEDNESSGAKRGLIDFGFTEPEAKRFLESKSVDLIRERGAYAIWKRERGECRHLKRFLADNLHHPGKYRLESEFLEWYRATDGIAPEPELFENQTTGAGPKRKRLEAEFKKREGQIARLPDGDVCTVTRAGFLHVETSSVRRFNAWRVEELEQILEKLEAIESEGTERVA